MTRIPLSARPTQGVDTFVLCIALGVGYSLLGWLVHLALAFSFAVLPPAVWLLDLLGGLPFELFYGALTGAFWSVFAVLILRHKPLKPAFVTLGVVLSLISIGQTTLVVLRPESVSGSLVYLVGNGPTVIFIITCLLLRRVLPATLPVCPNCAIEMKEITAGVCSACGDTSLFRRHNRQVALFALVGMFVSASIAALFVLTRSHSCGYWGDSTLVGFERGALLFYFDPLTYEGWYWSDVIFVPMSGYVWWPVFTEKIVFIPLWILFGLIFPPSLMVWRRCRRPPPGCCRKCGYNLTGLASARCPECGTDLFQAKPSRAGR